jgi:hypothetical protein
MLLWLGPTYKTPMPYWLGHTIVMLLWLGPTYNAPVPYWLRPTYYCAIPCSQTPTCHCATHCCCEWDPLITLLYPIVRGHRDPFVTVQCSSDCHWHDNSKWVPVKTAWQPGKRVPFNIRLNRYKWVPIATAFQSQIWSLLPQMYTVIRGSQLIWHGRDMLASQSELHDMICGTVISVFQPFLHWSDKWVPVTTEWHRNKWVRHYGLGVL